MVLSLLGAGFPEPCGLHGSGKGIPRLYGGKRPTQNGKHTPGPRHGAHPVAAAAHGAELLPIGNQVLGAGKQHHTPQLLRQRCGQPGGRFGGGQTVHPVLAAAKAQQGGGLPGVHPHNGGLHLLQKALDVCQPPGACAHAHRVQHNRDAAAVCRGTGGAGSGELGFVRGAGVQHNGAGQRGNIGHFLRGLGHDGACPDGQRQVGAVVGRNNVGNAVQKRVLRPDGSQRCGYGHKYKPRVTCSGRSAWISGCRSFPVQTG